MANIQRTSKRQPASPAASTADSIYAHHTAYRPVDRIGRAAAAVLLVGALATACASSHGSDAHGRPSESNSASRPSSQQWQAFEDFLQNLADTEAFSGAVLVTEDGRPLVRQAYGLADREANRPNNTATRFDIGSLGKMFTGVAIAQLVEHGRLDFDGRIGDYLLGLPAAVAAVTVHQLLTHTSGLGDFARNGYPEEAKSARTATELLPLVVDEPLEFTPGTRESYSNSGYVVLGAIIEAVTGQSYYDYVREHIFQPAGMARTGWFPPGQDADNTAIGYMAARGGLTPPGPADDATDEPAGAAGALTENSDVVPWGNPSGGAYATVGDLQRFAHTLMNNELLGAEMTTTVMDGKVSMSGGNASVAYGFTDGTINRVRIVSHGGGAPGVGASIDIYPDLGYVVVVLANYDGAVDPVRQRTTQILTG
jgi:CubicO group peptidase (beta-lactamase class C family)